LLAAVNAVLPSWAATARSPHTGVSAATLAVTQVSVCRTGVLTVRGCAEDGGAPPTGADPSFRVRRNAVMRPLVKAESATMHGTRIGLGTRRAMVPGGSVTMWGRISSAAVKGRDHAGSGDSGSRPGCGCWDCPATRRGIGW